jgi:hypothetical protein
MMILQGWLKGPSVKLSNTTNYTGFANFDRQNSQSEYNYITEKIEVVGFPWGLWACLVGAQICPTNFFAAYSTLVLVWLVANILVAYGILPTLLTPPSQILPTF